MAKMIMVTSQLVKLEHTLSFHKPIMRAIEQRNGDLAAKLMADHLKDATALLINEKTKQQAFLLHDRVVRTRQPLRHKSLSQTERRYPAGTARK
jgi:GntR family transcriptional repressor for pyruvate dehydrogenase complex